MTGVLESWHAGLKKWPIAPPLQHSIAPVLFFRSRPERLGLKGRVAFLQKSFETAFLARLFQPFVELLALAQARHRRELGVEHPGFAQPHHFQPLSGNV